MFDPFSTNMPCYNPKGKLHPPLFVLLLCILTSFWVLEHPKFGSNNFFSVLRTFYSFHIKKGQKWRKAICCRTEWMCVDFLTKMINTLRCKRPKLESEPLYLNSCDTPPRL